LRTVAVLQTEVQFQYRSFNIAVCFFQEECCFFQYRSMFLSRSMLSSIGRTCADFFSKISKSCSHDSKFGFRLFSFPSFMFEALFVWIFSSRAKKVFEERVYYSGERVEYYLRAI